MTWQKSVGKLFRAGPIRARQYHSISMYCVELYQATQSLLLFDMASKDFSSNIETSPRTQVSNSTTFRPPPQDKFLLVSEIFHHHYLNSPNHPIFKYEDLPGVVKTIYWSDWYLAIHRAGRYVRKIFGFSEEPNERPVIAMLANTGTCSTLHI
jgi:hypothetical protein